MQMHAAICRISVQGRMQNKEPIPRAAEREDAMETARADVPRTTAA